MPFVVTQWNGHDNDDFSEAVVGCFVTLRDSVEWAQNQKPTNLYRSVIPLDKAFTISQFEADQCFGIWDGLGNPRMF